MGKDKGEAKENISKPEMSYDERKKYVSVIAKPLADEKLCKKVLKLSKKAAKRRQIKRGVKEVVKAIRKNTKGQQDSFCVCTIKRGAWCFWFEQAAYKLHAYPASATEGCQGR
eukprot:GHRR01031339.1.p2 GENE.GHRR01031339.1~~GHRR01031339.1.p2  ORF type:complete len:113 (+),score=18.53 GHRR01031339.1:657-995(+)